MLAITKLNRFSLTMIVISLVIGMGIFRAASVSAQAALTPGIFFGAWIFGGLIALCGALTYAEIGARFQATGGYYKLFSYAYHPSIAFALNCAVLISNAAALGGVAIIGSEYISEVIFKEGASPLQKTSIAILAIITFYTVNLAGLSMSSKVQNVLMFIKIGMLAVIISGLFVVDSSSNEWTLPTMPFNFWSYLSSFGSALIAVCFTYGGYQQSINFGEEVHDAPRTIPKGIITGILIVLALYLLANYSYYKVIGFQELKEANGIAALVAEKIFGPIGKTLFSILLFIAVLAFVNVQLLSNPRVMYAMADDGILPKAFQNRNTKNGVLTVALSAFTLLTIVILFFAKTFDNILGFAMFLESIGMATSAYSLFILRKKTQHLDNTNIYRMKGVPWQTILFIMSYLFITLIIIIKTPLMALTGCLVFLGILLLYFIFRKL
ncbi:MAG: APC family permease [Bacteroidota bacterium]|nr:APC family permease [Bacteroidota bacterium]